MKCLVVGFGSIGQRHVRILEKLNQQVAVVSLREINFSRTYSSLLEAFRVQSPDYVVIANETHKHYQTLEALEKLKFKGIVLVEKPLFHKNLPVPELGFQKAYVNYNLRFHPILQKLHAMLQKERVLYAQVYVGQYLPDWRPGQDYRRGYSAKAAQGGGVLLDLSHELDYLQWIFGPWQRLVAMGGKYSDLEINSDDLFSLMLVMEKCPLVQVHVNYLDRISRRELTLITENHSMKADLVAHSLQINQTVFDYEVERDATYQAVHEAILSGQENSLCTLQEGLNVLEMIKGAQQSAKERKWINEK